MFEGVPSKDSIEGADKILYGVSTPSQREAGGEFYDSTLAEFKLYGVTYKIRRHPELLMLDHIDEWIEDYRYTNHFKVPVSFDDRHPCWVDLMKEYEYIVKGLSNG